MAWRDRLIWAKEDSSQKKMASFRNAYFFVRDSDHSVGRRNVVHQYPQKDKPYIEDLGKDTDEFSINGYVVQNSENFQDYISARDELIAALKEPGAGTLIHPFYGEILVNLVGKAQIAESFANGGIARFTMSFTLVEEEGKVLEKIGVADSIEVVDDAVERSLQDAADAFGIAFIPDNVPDFSITSVQTTLGKFNKMMRSAMASIQGLGPAQLSRSLAILSEEYTEIDVDTINDSCALGERVVGMFNGLLSLAGMYGDIVIEEMFGSCSSLVRGIASGPMSGALPLASLSSGFAESTLSTQGSIFEDFGITAAKASLGIARFGEAEGNSSPSQYGGELKTIPIMTATRARQAANQEAIVNLVRLNAITTAVRIAVRIEFSSHDSAVEIMDKVLDSIDIQLLKLGNDSANIDYSDFNINISSPDNYQALKSLRPVFVKAMLNIKASLHKIVDYEVPAATVPSLVVAYDKYNDLGREKEIINRNTSLISHPGFLPGGQTLEILSS